MSKYPNIEKACRLIALDNGGINRFRSIDEQSIELERWLEDRAQYTFNVAEIETWLGTLAASELETVCIGGQDDPEQVGLLKRAPSGASDFLDTYFEEVC